MMSIIVPVFNESDHIVANLDLLIAEIEEPFSEFEILVVSDGSTDGTNLKVFSFKDQRIRLLVSEHNAGKGHAVRRGFQEARGKYIFFIDGGMELHPRVLHDFWQRMQDQQADIVIGSKRHPQSKIDYPILRRGLSALYQRLVKALFEIDVTDTQVGLKLFRREVVVAIVNDLRIDRYGFDLELLSLARWRGFHKIVEAPIQMDYFHRYRRMWPAELLHIFRVGLSLLKDTFLLHRRMRELRKRGE